MTEKQVTIGACYGLEIPITYACTELEKANAWIQRKVIKEIKIAEKNENWLK